MKGLTPSSFACLSHLFTLFTSVQGILQIHPISDTNTTNNDYELDERHPPLFDGDTSHNNPSQQLDIRNGRIGINKKRHERIDCTINVQFFGDEEPTQFTEQRRWEKNDAEIQCSGTTADGSGSLNLHVNMQARKSGHGKHYTTASSFISGVATIGQRSYFIYTNMTSDEIQVREIKDMGQLPENGDMNEEDDSGVVHRLAQSTSKKMYANVPGSVRGGMMDVNSDQIIVNRDLNEDSGDVVTIMCIYSQEACCNQAAGNNNPNVNIVSCDLEECQPVMNAMCTLAVEETNVAFEKSGISTRLKLVHAGMIHASHMESETDKEYMCNILHDMRDSEEYAFKKIRDLRDEKKADLVGVILNSIQWCGCGYTFNGDPNRAFFTTSRFCATSYYSFGHEIGHNMGCNHSPKKNAVLSGTAYGYQDPDDSFRTIMAYNCEGKSCERIQRYSTSDPSITYNGKQMGTSSQDNAQQIMDTSYKVANFRVSDSISAPPIEIFCEDVRRVNLDMNLDVGDSSLKLMWKVLNVRDSYQVIRRDLTAEPSSKITTSQCIVPGSCFTIILKNKSNRYGGKYHLSINGENIKSNDISTHKFKQVRFALDSTDAVMFKVSAKDMRNCSWVREDASRVEIYCKRVHIQKRCPYTCNAC